MSETATPWLLEVRHLRKSFPIRRGFNRKLVGTVPPSCSSPTISA